MASDQMQPATRITAVQAALNHLRTVRRAEEAGYLTPSTTSAKWLVHMAINRRAEHGRKARS